MTTHPHTAAPGGQTMDVTINEGVAHMMLAAYRLGRGDSSAQAPKGFLGKCVKLIEAESKEEAQAVIEAQSDV